MQPDDLLDNDQSQARPVYIRRLFLALQADLLKFIENFLQVLLSHANTRIGDTHRHEPRLLINSGLDRNGSASGGELDRITDEIHEDLNNPVRIKRHLRQGIGDVLDKFYILILCPGLQGLHDLTDDFGNRGGLTPQFHFMRLKLGHIQQIVDKGAQTFQIPLGIG